MNILIPDSWLRQHLKTAASPKDIEKYLSLCGQSVERIIQHEGELVYDIEVTTNRVDTFSVRGMAREAAAILPEFKKKAELLPITDLFDINRVQAQQLDIQITNDSSLVNRILAIKLKNIQLGPSPKWLQKKLELVEQRPLNNAIDITNYVMWEIGHPLHAFDYDRLKEKKIIVRSAKKGEKLTTLENKTYTMQGGEIIFDDGTGEIIDLPGIMGTANTVVTNETRNVLLFIENSKPEKIRYASMGLAIRSQAAVINEKNPDPDLAYTAMQKAVHLFQEVCHAQIGSRLTDIYSNKPPIHSVSVSENKINTYMGTKLSQEIIKNILSRLDFKVEYKSSTFIVTPPSWRAHDITIAEDIIEEIARIYGYHNIENKLPDTEPPMTMIDPIMNWEEEVKVRLRDWGYTETLTYSFISEELMDIFTLDKNKAYKISNPLSQDWVYMRPKLIPSLLTAIRENLGRQENLKLFELSMIYEYIDDDLPHERPTLAVAWTGEKFLEAKGLAEAIFALFGIDFPLTSQVTGPYQELKHFWNVSRVFVMEHYGAVGLLNQHLLTKLSIDAPVTALVLNFEKLVNDSKPAKQYTPIPKYPPVIEDLSFELKEKTDVGAIMNSIQSVSKLIYRIKLLDKYKHSITFRIYYLDIRKSLSNEDVKEVREKIISKIESEYNASLKGSR